VSPYFCNQNSTECEGVVICGTKARTKRRYKSLQRASEASENDRLPRRKRSTLRPSNHRQKWSSSHGVQIVKILGPGVFK
jgi:hypothetical protein